LVGGGEFTNAKSIARFTRFTEMVLDLNAVPGPGRVSLAAVTKILGEIRARGAAEYMKYEGRAFE
jgi:hypothetical protein